MTEEEYREVDDDIASPNPAAVPLPEPEQSPKWRWAGDTQHPGVSGNRDGLSDLFETGTEEELEDADEVTDVDIDTDVLDTDDDGSMDSLVGVSDEDVIGRPPPPRRRPRTIRRPPSSGQGMSGIGY